MTGQFLSACKLEVYIENPSRDSHYILNVCLSVHVSVHICDTLLILHLSPLYDVPFFLITHWGLETYSVSLVFRDHSLGFQKVYPRPYKPYIFWKLIIWRWQWPRRRLTKRQIQRQRHTDTDNPKCFQDPTYAIFSSSNAGGSRI